jgi:hypothetical protein
MVPVSIALSPLNPDTELIIVMRTINVLQKVLFLDQPLPADPVALAAKFIIRQFQFMSKDQEQRKMQLNNDLQYVIGMFNKYIVPYTELRI